MRFNLGRQVITSNARSVLMDNDVHVALIRHTNCDYGNMCADDAKDNDEAVETEEGRVFSSYTALDGTVFWIITNFDDDDTYTTVMLPEDY